MANLQQELSGKAVDMAQRLLGCYLVRDIGDEQIIGRIVETEAYDQTDTASHSHNGQTPRTAVMFGPAGFLYVYFTYGMHYCCNIVTGAVGEGSAVLVRALEPVSGETLMAENRGGRVMGVGLSNGPAKLCQALQIAKQLNAHDLAEQPLQLQLNPPVPISLITQTTRIGISRAQDAPWRFYLTGNPYISKP